MKPKRLSSRKKKPEKQPETADQDLVKQALEGDQMAYKALMRRHERAIFHVIFRLVRHSEESRDLVQETFMKAFASLATYKDQFRFSTWLYRIAANCSIDYIRKKKIEALSLDQPIQTRDSQVKIELPDTSQNPEAEWFRRKQIGSIQEAIDSLPESYREVILMRHKDEKSYQEISEILSLPVGTVKARIFRGRELLKKKLKAWRRTSLET
ncbi:MAG: sigma-70 family RNA polymerase sigma factor [candidate division Zixibacteria bacterium]|nr:sigma-70 family RNA polymerase sigma factor [candidate division Zixibacteria bacterium]